ncbi:MAG: hypothetical protein Kow0098_04650 [Ignavibacteriaceae bacterium]
MPKRWTEEELKILKKFYRKRGAQYVAKFVEHSADTVMNKAASLGIRYGNLHKWEKWEDNYLKRHYSDRKISSIAKTLKRSERSVIHRAGFLLLTGSRAPGWSEKELTTLKRLYPNRNYSLEQIAKLLNRTAVSVRIKAVRLGLSRGDHYHRWTKQEHNYFIRNVGKKTHQEIADHLGIEKYKVSQYAQRNNIRIRFKMPAWTEEEVAFLRNNYNRMPFANICSKLNRSVYAVKNKASRLGITETPATPWTEEEIDYLKNNYKKYEYKQIAAHLGRTEKAVVVKARALKLKKRKKRNR